MSSPFWKLFVQRVVSPPDTPASGEMGWLVNEIAMRLAALNAPAAADVFTSFAEQVAERYEQIRKGNPSEVGTSPGTPKPIPVPPEVIVEALREFDEKEILESIRGMLEGDARKIEDFLPELRLRPSPPIKRNSIRTV